jgi:hypothetical protein
LGKDEVMNMLNRYRHAVCLALLIIIAVALIHKVLFFGKVLLPADLLLVMTPWRYHARKLFPEFVRVHAPLLDVIQQYYPWRKFYSESLREGELPLWNPYMFSGTTFVGNGQSAVFYPLNLIFVFMPVDVAFGWFVLIHMLLAAFGTYALLTLWKAHPAPAFVGACSFMLCGFLVAWLNYITILCTAVWLPVCMTAYEYSLRRLERGHSMPCILSATFISSLPLALSALAGHMQMAFYVWFSLLTYALVRCVQDSVCAHKGGLRCLVEVLGRHMLVFIFSLVFALMLSSPQLLPSLELSRMCTRAGQFSYEAVLANSLQPEQWIRLIVPNFFGNYRDGTHWSPFEVFNFIERTGYVGLLPLLLASIGFAFKHPLRPFAISIFIIGFMLATGSPIYLLLGMLPGIQQMVGASRALLLFDFSIALLATLGAQAIMSMRSELSLERKKIFRFVLTPCVVAIALIALSCAYSVSCFWEVITSSPLAGYERWQLLKALLLLVLSCLAIALTLHRRTAKFSSALMIALVVADLFSFAYDLNPSCDRRMVFFWTDSLRWISEHIGKHRVMAIGTDAIKHWMPSNTLMVYRLRDVQGSDSLWTMRYARFLKCVDPDLPGFSLDNLDSQLLDLASVKFFISGAPVKHAKNIKEHHALDMWLYENLDVFPRAFMVTDWLIVNSPQQSFSLVCEADKHGINLLDKAIIELPEQSRQYKLVPPATKRKRGNVIIAFEASNSLMLDATSFGTQVLLIADSYYPGWRAYVDGEPRQLFIADYVFRGLFVPSGRHIVWLSYEPASVLIGVYSACVCVSVFVGIAVVLLFCRRPSSQPAV